MAGHTDGLRQELRSFVQTHRDGWGHEEWMTLVSALADQGHETDDLDRLGLALEQERVREVLADLPVSGLGPKRQEVLSVCYPRMWDLEHASVEELAALPSVPRTVAVNLFEALHR